MRQANVRMHTRKEHDFSHGKRRAALATQGKTRITIYLDDSILAKLKTESERTGKVYQVLINEALQAYDNSAHLDDDEAIAEFLTAGLQDPDPDVFLSSLGSVARARGLDVIAAHTGLSRESLRRALAPGARPRFDTLLRALQSLGMKISIAAAQSSTRSSDRRRARVTATAGRQAGTAIVKGIARGEQAIAASRTVTHAEAKRRLGRWRK